MQSFKQFLIEEENHNPKNYDLSLSLNIETAIFVIDLVEDDTPENIQITEQSIQGELRHKFPNYNIDVFFDYYNELIISCDINKNQKNISQSFANELVNDINKAFQDMLPIALQTNTTKPYCVLIREQLDKDIKIDTREIMLYLFWTKPFTLSNFDKQVECEKLIIDYPEKIIGNVLSLLRISKLKTIYCSKKSPKWLEIIQKHLQTRDILECQEELIANGLNNYAKL